MKPTDREIAWEEAAFSLFSLVVVISFSLTVSVGVLIGWLLWGTR